MMETRQSAGAGEGTSSPAGVLIVDDYEPFRRFVCGVLRQQQNLRIIGEARDGLEAVQQADALQPDLIVLDIGLPNMNGIDTARAIRKLVPHARIVFLTQEASTDMVREAFSLGAYGYVLKAYAGDELLGALEAAVHCKEFVSNGLGRDVTRETKVQFSEK